GEVLASCHHTLGGCRNGIEAGRSVNGPRSDRARGHCEGDPNSLARIFPQHAKKNKATCHLQPTKESAGAQSKGWEAVPPFPPPRPPIPLRHGPPSRRIGEPFCSPRQPTIGPTGRRLPRRRKQRCPTLGKGLFRRARLDGQGTDSLLAAYHGV